MDPMSDPKAYRKTWLSWALYDVGNSAFYLVVTGSLFPIFFQEIFVAANTPEGETASGTVRDTLLKEGGGQLALTALVATAVVAVLGPILGTIADRYRAKKKFLTAFAGLGVLSAALMVFIGDQGLLLASILYATGTVGVAGSLVFYDALLPGIAKEGDLDRISTIGFALGYAGSPLLYILNVFMVLHPDWFGFPDMNTGFRVAFFTVAVWWAAFLIPLLRRVPEPDARTGDAPPGNVLMAGFRQLARTFRKVREYKHLLLFLVAFWIYVDGINTIIKLATPFGKMLGVDNNDLFYALLATQFVGVPATLAFGWLAKRTSAKTGILTGLSFYILICIGASFMQKGAAWQFYALAISVGLVQGGVQALSRSLFASMIPKENSAELFGFYSTMAKFASLLGPAVLWLVWTFGDDPRRGILAIAVFFIAGGIFLSRVDVAKGREMVSS